MSSSRQPDSPTPSSDEEEIKIHLFISSLDGYTQNYLPPTRPSIEKSMYGELLQRVAERYQTFSSKPPIQILIDDDMLAALRTHCEKGNQVGFEELIILLDAKNITQDTISESIQLIPLLAQSGLRKITLSITLRQNGFTDQELHELICVVKEHKLIIDISLPGVNNKSVKSRELHHILEDNKLLKTQIRFKKNNQCEQDTAHSITEILTPAIPAERKPFPSKISLPKKQVQVQIQQERQQERQQQRKSQVAQNQTGDKTKDWHSRNGDRLLTLEDLRSQIRFEEIPVSHTPICFNSTTLEKQYWNKWVGKHHTPSQKKEDELAADGTRYHYSFPSYHPHVPAPDFDRISQLAANKLIQHADLFAEGLNAIDEKYLPEGFAKSHRVIDRFNEIILYYDPQLKAKSKIAPRLRTKSKEPLFSASFCEDLINQLKEQNAYQSITAMYDNYYRRNRENYDQKKETLLHYWLPTLIFAFHAEEQIKIINLCSPNEQFNPILLDCFLQHYQELSQLTDEQVRQIENDRIVQASWINEVTRLNISIFRFHQVAREVWEQKQPSPFRRFIQPDLSYIHAKLNQFSEDITHWGWGKKLELKSQHLIALLAIQHRYGNEGVSELFSIWQKYENILDDLKPIFIDPAHSLTIWIDDYLMQEVLDKLAKLKTSDHTCYEWWQALLKTHRPLSNGDYLPDLYGAFEEFLYEITHHHDLMLYTPVTFAERMNLPTRLGRMLTILNRCEPQSRKAQWKCLTQLSLGFEGAVKILSNRDKEKTCRFIVPEMKVDEQNIPDNYGKLGTYQAELNRLKDDNESGVVKRDTYRYLAYQEVGLPLDIHQIMIQAIEETHFEEVQKRQLFKILAGASAGGWCQKANPQECVSHWKELFAIIQNFNPRSFIKRAAIFVASKAMGVSPQQHTIQLLSHLTHPPYIPQLKQLAKLIMNELDSEKDIQDVGEELLKDCTTLNFQVLEYGNVIYDGMHFYGNQQYEQNKEGGHLLRKHLHVVTVIKKTVENRFRFGANEDVNKHIRSLISLISHFNLINFDDKKLKSITTFVLDCCQIYDLNGYSVDAENLRIVLSVFAGMRQPASPEILYDILQQASKSTIGQHYAIGHQIPIHVKIVRYIQQMLPNHFTDEFIAQCMVGEREKVEKVLQEKISQNEIRAPLQELIFTLRNLSLNTDTDSIIDDWQAIIDGLSNSEKLFFFEGCQYLKLAGDLKDLKRLLHLIRTHNYYDEFQFFIAKTAARFKAGDGKYLLSKAWHFLSSAKIIITSYFQKTDSQRPIITNMDLWSLTADFILTFDEANEFPIHIDDFINQLATKIYNKLTPIINLIENYPGDRDLLLETCNKYLRLALPSLTTPEVASENDDGISVTDIKSRLKKEREAQIELRISLIHHFCSELIKINDTDIIRSICDLLNHTDHPIDLLDFANLLQSDNYTKLLIDKRKLILKILAIEINLAIERQRKNPTENQPINLRELFDNLLKFIDQDWLAAIYDHAPYPPLSQVLSWHTKTTQDESRQHNTTEQLIMEQYKDFDKKPFPRNDMPDESSASYDNGFHLQLAISQAQRIQGLKEDCQYEENDANKELYQLRSKISVARVLETSAIREKLIEFRHAHLQHDSTELDETANHDTIQEQTEISEREKQNIVQEQNELNEEANYQNILQEQVALLVELLFRTTSQELNTTQYLAFYTLLKTKRLHALSEIETSEGKSRVTMLLVAYLYLQGKTVDFITSDMGLVLRDYLAYRPFFLNLGAKINVITLHTPMEGYQLSGINFSTIMLELFRAQFITRGKKDSVMHPDKTMRAVVIDEVDLLLCDSFPISNNYSSATDPAIKDIPWVYGLMIDFMTRNQQDPNKLTHLATHQELLAYAKSHLTQEQFEIFQNISNEQLETWQIKAKEMFALRLGRDFVIIPDDIIDTEYGPTVSSQARTIDALGRDDKHSTFTKGLHNLLDAWLNKLKYHLDDYTFLDEQHKSHLRNELKKCKTDFYVRNETQIIHSSNHITLLNEYDETFFYGLTGTLGSKIEQNEITKLYPAKNPKGITHEKQEMLLISIPRHNSLERKMQAIIVGKDKNDQYGLLMEKLAKDAQKGRPAIIYCEDDFASQDLENEQKNNFEKMDVTRILTTTSIEEETHYIEQTAGKPGKATITAKRLARGTNANLIDTAKQHGFSVYLLFSPKTLRDLLQIIGRTGRFGKNGKGTPGRACLILNKGSLALDSPALLLAVEAYLDKEQEYKTYQLQVERLIQIWFMKYHAELQTRFYDNANHLDFSPWAKFYETIEERREQVSNDIYSQSDNIDDLISALEMQWTAHRKFCEDEYSKRFCRENMTQTTGVVIDSREQPLENEIKDLLKESFSNNAEISIEPLPTPPDRSKREAGRPELHTTFFSSLASHFKNLFSDWHAWREGRGYLFSNFMAWWKGIISFSEFFFGTKSPPPYQAGGKGSISELRYSSAHKGMSTAKISREIKHPTTTTMNQLNFHPPEDLPIPHEMITDQEPDKTKHAKVEGESEGEKKKVQPKSIWSNIWEEQYKEGDNFLRQP